MQHGLSLLIAIAVSSPCDAHLSVVGYRRGEGSAAETWRVDTGVQRSQPLPALGSIAGACGCARASLRASHRSIPPAPGSSAPRWGEGRGQWQPALDSSQGPWFMRHGTLEELEPSGCLGDAESLLPGARRQLSAGCPQPRCTSHPGCGSGRVTGQRGKLSVQMKGCKYIYSSTERLC